MKDESPMTVRFEPKVKKGLEQASKNTNIPQNSLVIIAVKELLRQYEGDGIQIKEE